MADRRPALHRSIFVRLVVVMLAMGAVLLLMVGGFFFLVVIPGLHDSLHRVVGPHARAIGDMQPDLERARRFAESLDVGIRYEGPEGGWTTEESVPTVDEVQASRRNLLAHVFIPRRMTFVVPTDSGTYVFTRSVGKDFENAHTSMLILLLVLMAGVFAMAYLVMRGALRPLRLLGDGVARLSQGDLNVVVPKRSEDEFGVLTDAFNQMTERVRDIVRGREELLRDVSHELRSPLTRIKVALELLPDGPQKASMEDDVREMESMVSGLLEMERLRGSRVTGVENLDVVEVVREVVARYAGDGPGAAVTAAPEAAPVRAAREDVRTVVRNLLENAVKFSLPDSRSIAVHVEIDGGVVVIRVVDDGSGLPDGDVERLFEPFYRPDPSRSRRTGGYGLGLSICRRIMDAYGGSLELSRNAPRGTVASARFPPG